MPDHERVRSRALTRRASEHRSSELLLSDLAAVSALAEELGVASDAADFDVGLTTDGMARSQADILRNAISQIPDDVPKPRRGASVVEALIEERRTGR